MKCYASMNISFYKHKQKQKTPLQFDPTTTDRTHLAESRERHLSINV